MPSPFDAHFKLVVKAILDGRLVPFLGAGFNVPGRPDASSAWNGTCPYLPSGSELSAYLAEAFDYPNDLERKNLVRVSQYVEVLNGTGPLYELLRRVFVNENYRPFDQHRFLASLPGVTRPLGIPGRYQLIVTTNYDDMVELAFREAGREYDLAVYVATGPGSGKFVHRHPDGHVNLIEKPNEYPSLSLEQRPVILKIHGAVDREHEDKDSFVITEDDYIDYMTRLDIEKLLPVKPLAKLRKCNFLFLGYSLADWNLRAILGRIWGEQSRSYQSWAVQLNPDPIDVKFWTRRGVEIIDADVGEYICELTKLLRVESVSGKLRPPGKP